MFGPFGIVDAQFVLFFLTKVPPQACGVPMWVLWGFMGWPTNTFPLKVAVTKPWQIHNLKFKRINHSCTPKTYLKHRTSGGI